MENTNNFLEAVKVILEMFSMFFKWVLSDPILIVLFFGTTIVSIIASIIRLIKWNIYKHK